MRLIEQGRETTLEGVSDDGLMLLCADDMPQAFAGLVAHNERAIRRFCLGMLGDRALS